MCSLFVFPPPFPDCSQPHSISRGDRVKSAPKPGCSSRLCPVCSGARLGRCGWTHQRLCPHRVAQGTGKDEATWRDCPQWFRAARLYAELGGDGEGAKMTRTSASLRSLCLTVDEWAWWRVPHVHFASPAQGFSAGFCGQVTLRKAASCVPLMEIHCDPEHDKCTEKSCSKERGELYFELAFPKPSGWRSHPHRSSTAFPQRHWCVVHPGRAQAHVGQWSFKFHGERSFESICLRFGVC